MSIVETVFTALQDEGYRPQKGEAGVLTFRYYGQDATFRTQQLGPVTIAELSCRLPRPAPTADAAQQFSVTHPLARLGADGNRATLSVATMMTLQDVDGQVRASLQLLDQYVADVVFGTAAGEGSAEQAQVPAAPPAPPEVQPPVTPPAGQTQNVIAVPPTPPRQDASTSTTTPPTPPAQPNVPDGWEEFWPLMHERFQPLARELARLQVPPPTDMQVDMLQNGQVKGTAIMLWGTAPNAVVICEPGQMVPPGYLGGTWLRHFTVEQVAASVQHNLKRAGLL